MGTYFESAFILVIFEVLVFWGNNTLRLNKQNTFVFLYRQLYYIFGLMVLFEHRLSPYLAVSLCASFSALIFWHWKPRGIKIFTLLLILVYALKIVFYESTSFVESCVLTPLVLLLIYAPWILVSRNH